MFDVIIVGAGPAGLIAADKLADHLKILVVDKGRDMDKRHCPALKDGICRRCSPCNIMCGLGGAGGLSDGKLNLRPDIGGNLEEFVDREKAWELVEEVDKFFLKHGAPEELYSPEKEKIEKILKKSAAAGINFIPIIQRHIGSDKTPAVIKSIKENLKKRGVEFFLETEALDIISKNKRIEGLVIKDKSGKENIIKCKFLILAPGRSGSMWLAEQMKKLSIPVKHNPVDIGVRVEVSSIVMEDITRINWDPKFHIITKSYDDFVRTFCVCNKGFVVEEAYDDFKGVNGHSMRTKTSDNTNFAFLVKVELTEPVENTSAYALSIAKISNTLGGGKPIIQRLGDLRKGRRSTWRRIKRSPVKPTLKDVTPGDIALVLPYRIVLDIIEGLEALDKVIPGVASDSTLLYAPEIKLYAMRIEVDNHMRTPIKGLYAVGDGAGLSRGIVGAAATALIAAEHINLMCP
ncbi:MAG TPA: NAD(P)/FAD-dependent oxidoreductase [Methanothermobacter sp.]|nr:monooxygenase FAD-binding protein [Methanothermobacter sp. MT-2]HHW05697.1 NAD(P)/FAD-dependent oxidoreductase [Methanothermobacter sp.]HOK72263.1 NAD(P)/FAD-dependent oxidoreductase [Methanothermobacter sp.]HOL68935.1 NAD(P)/FAD-dependent oxidoreductase [Methanothermobacter sp.]HPQ04926.1 NAD(P)/FAD-dependent oxidoreductase [Methanothermobacter sp.]